MSNTRSNVVNRIQHSTVDSSFALSVMDKSLPEWQFSCTTLIYILNVYFWSFWLFPMIWNLPNKSFLTDSKTLVERKHISHSATRHAAVRISSLPVCTLHICHPEQKAKSTKAIRGSRNALLRIQIKRVVVFYDSGEGRPARDLKPKSIFSHSSLLELLIKSWY